MRFPQKLALLWAMLTITGCRRHDAVPETPMPPNTVLLSGMMRELSAQPGFTEALIHQIDQGGKKGPALLTPQLIDELRKRILGKDWQGLDRFPGWTMREINPTVRVVDRVVGKDQKDKKTRTVSGSTAQPIDDQFAKEFLDLGEYTLDKEQTVSLNVASQLPGFTTEGIVSDLGAGVTRGDGPNPQLAPQHAESQRLADVLNRLAMNKLEPTKPFNVSPEGITGNILGEVTMKGGVAQAVNESRYQSPGDLISALFHSGHTVTVTDSRYFANFGHLHYKGHDVMMPFWINTQIAVPHTGGLFTRSRPLLVPVSHAEYEWHIRGPRINADVSWYFGIDGKAEWRTMDTLDQAWVLKRDAHTYTGEAAIEVTRLTGLFTVAYMHQHAKRPDLPFGGYYALGVCQDGVSAVEHKMTGRVTLFPNTADSSLFDDPRDAEVNALIAAIPKDRAGARPGPERVFGSLPTENFDAITVPGLADDLKTTYAAWQCGTLEHTHGVLFYASITAVLAAVGAGCIFALARRRKQNAY